MITDICLADAEEMREGFASALMVARQSGNDIACMALMSYYDKADSLCVRLGGKSTVRVQHEIQRKINKNS